METNPYESPDFQDEPVGSGNSLKYLKYTFSGYRFVTLAYWFSVSLIASVYEYKDLKTFLGTIGVCWFTFILGWFVTVDILAPKQWLKNNPWYMRIITIPLGILGSLLYLWPVHLWGLENTSLSATDFIWIVLATTMSIWMWSLFDLQVLSKSSTQFML